MVRYLFKNVNIKLIYYIDEKEIFDSKKSYSLRCRHCVLKALKLSIRGDAIEVTNNLIRPS